MDDRVHLLVPALRCIRGRRVLFFLQVTGRGGRSREGCIAPRRPSPRERQLRSVSAVFSRYSRRFGSGGLTLGEFHDLYLEATWAGYVNDIVRRRITPND